MNNCRAIDPEGKGKKKVAIVAVLKKKEKMEDGTKEAEEMKG